MKQILVVVRYSFIRNCREPSTVFELVLLPLALILVLGAALTGAFDTRDIGSTSVAYVIESDSHTARAVRDFLARDDVARFLAATDAGTLDHAKKLLSAEEAFAVIHVPADLGTNGEAPAIRLIERTGNQLRVGVVRAVLRNYMAAANVTAALLSEAAVFNPESARTSHVAYEPMPPRIETQAISRTGRVPGSFDYYSISMLVFFLMYVAGYSVDALREDILEPIGDRLRTTGMPPWAHLSGRLTANTMSGLIQACVIVLITRLVFGVNWGDRPLVLAAIVAAITLFAVSLGAFVLALVRDGPKALTIVGVIAIGSMIVSGGAIQFGAVGPGLRAVQRMLPHYQGQTALLAMVYDRDPGLITEAVAYFTGGAAVALALTVLLLRRNA